MISQKLFQHAPDGTQTFRLLRSDGTLVTRLAAGLPLPIWPDGRWCSEVALYLKQFADANASLYDRGGTIGAYASQISHLVRFCWRKDVAFHLLTDDLFSEFICELKDETTLRNNAWELRRESRTVVSIGRRCLDFLEFIGKLHRLDSFIDECGRIRARRKLYTHKTKNSHRSRSVQYWHHNAFPSVSPKNKRHLIGQEYIERIRRAAVTLSDNPFLQRRRLVLLRLLEATGARRSELVRLTVKSVVDATRMARPFLKIITAKKRLDAAGEQKYRLVPIEHHELQLICDYIEFYRAPVIERHLRSSIDHCVLLVSYNTGRPIVPSTVTLDLHYLRAKAGIKGKAHPQLFRHRFITYALLKLIKAHKLKDRSEFEMIFRLDGFKMEVAELTGHASIESLDSYIDWAFIVLYQYDKTARSIVDAAGLEASVRSAIPELEELMNVLPPDQLKREVIARMKAIEKGLHDLQAYPESGEVLN